MTAKTEACKHGTRYLIEKYDSLNNLHGYYCHACVLEEQAIHSERERLLNELEKIHKDVCLAQMIDDEHPDIDIVLAEECEECKWIAQQRGKE